MPQLQRIDADPLITVLGPTATGKTRLAALLAHRLGGEVISADSRQVYRQMDIGTGKDYDDYIVEGVRMPVHLTDIADPGTEYNVYQYQRDFHQACSDIRSRGKRVILCGGSGMYLESVLKGYRMPVIEGEEEFRKCIADMSDGELIRWLSELKPLHNKTDTEDRERLIKALMVALRAREECAFPAGQRFMPPEAVIFGIHFPRGLVMSRISERLKKRLADGMVEETAALIRSGITPERLMKYGLEYKFVALFLSGKLDYEQLYDQLNIAIRQFAKRQMTWFRRMERQGFSICWIDGRLPEEQLLESVMAHLDTKQ